MQIDVDGEVMGHLLILQHKQGGTLSDVIQRLLDEQAEEPTLPMKMPREYRRGSKKT